MKRPQPARVLAASYLDGIGIERCTVCLKPWPCAGQHDGGFMFDVRSMELATVFLSEEPDAIAKDKDAIDRVAQAIQDAAEAACEDERRRAVEAMDAKSR
jgi:hypothetical protein